MKLKLTKNDEIRASAKNKHLDIEHPSKKSIEFPSNKTNIISSKEDMRNFNKQEISSKPLQANVYSIQKEFFTQNDGSYSYRPKKSEIIKEIRKIKNDIKLTDLEIIRNYKTRSKDNFFRKLIIQDRYTIIIFASDAMISHLRSEHYSLFIDGYHKVPKGFYQLLTFYIYNESISFYGPIIYCLINSKDSECYNMIFFEIKNLLHFLSKQSSNEYLLTLLTLMTDFEQALINTAKVHFENTRLKGCYFHWLQALWRWAIKNKLKNKENSHRTQEIINALSSLCFLKPNLVRQAFESIKIYYLNNVHYKIYKEAFNYFYSTWIDGIFDISLWNYCEIDGVNFEYIDKTNNCVESFHNQVSKLINKVKFIYIFVVLPIGKMPLNN